MVARSSDHRPILASCFGVGMMKIHLKNPFRYEVSWSVDEEFCLQVENFCTFSVNHPNPITKVQTLLSQCE